MLELRLCEVERSSHVQEKEDALMTRGEVYRTLHQAPGAFDSPNPWGIGHELMKICRS